MAILNFFGPTQGMVNRDHLVSFRHKLGLSPVATEFKVTQVLMDFSAEVTGTSGVLPNGFVVEINGVPVVVSGVSQPTPTQILVAHALAIVGDDAEVIYDGLGDWVAVDTGQPLRAFSVSGVVI